MEQQEMEAREVSEKTVGAIKARDGSAFLQYAEESHYADLASLFQELEEGEDRAFFVQTIAPKDFSDILAQLPGSQRDEAISYYNLSQQKALFMALSDDDRVDVLQDLSNKRQTELLALLPDEDKVLTRTLLNYPEDTAGGRMTTKFGKLTEEMTVKQALDALRDEQESAETLGRIFVVDSKENPVGILRLRDLAFSPWSTPLTALLQPVEHWILAAADQEEAASLIKKYDLFLLPVVDESNRLLGVITYDDAMEIQEVESTEDLEKMAGISGEVVEETYLNTSVMRHFRRRFGWLFSLGVLAIASGYVMLRFEGVLQQAFLLSLFLPMVVAAGGNSGGQASTMIIRAMALKELQLADLYRVAWKELRLGLILGLLLAGGIGLIAVFILPAFQPSLPEGVSFLQFGAAVAVALAIQVVLSTLIGALLPLGAYALKIDPAAIAAPAITTIVDVSGMVIYFTVASSLLPL